MALFPQTSTNLRSGHQLPGFGRAELGILLSAPQHAAAVGRRGVTPVANLARRAWRGIGTAQLDPALQDAIGATKLGRARRVPAACGDDQHRERENPGFSFHEIGTACLGPNLTQAPARVKLLQAERLISNSSLEENVRGAAHCRVRVQVCAGGAATATLPIRRQVCDPVGGWPRTGSLCKV